MSTVHTFQHEAMKTTFTLRLLSDDPKLAKNAATACIEEIDLIEASLNRYLEGSDIWEINRMQADQTRFISEHCYNCIHIGLEVYTETQGLFDITLGQQIEHRKNNSEGPPPIQRGQLMLDPKRPAIHCTESGREIDLGGIGKGYALDQLKTITQDWGIASALLSAGASTLLAFGDKAWPIQLEGDPQKRIINLENQALSASGTEIQGSHIVSPQDRENSYTHPRIWALDSTAALADAWSTAALLMPPDSLETAKKYRDILH